MRSMVWLLLSGYRLLGFGGGQGCIVESGSILDISNRVLQEKLDATRIVRRQLSCPVGDNYLDRLTDM